MATAWIQADQHEATKPLTQSLTFAFTQPYTSSYTPHSPTHTPSQAFPLNFIFKRFLYPQNGLQGYSPD